MRIGLVLYSRRGTRRIYSSSMSFGEESKEGFLVEVNWDVCPVVCFCTRVKIYYVAWRGGRGGIRLQGTETLTAHPYSHAIKETRFYRTGSLL